MFFLKKQVFYLKKPTCFFCFASLTVGILVSQALGDSGTDWVTQALIAHSVILNERCRIHQCTLILNTVLTLYCDSMIYYIIINNGMNIVK